MYKYYWLFVVVFLWSCGEDISTEWLTGLPGSNFQQDLLNIQLWDLNETYKDRKSLVFKSDSFCVAEELRYPVPEVMYDPGSYNNRGFYVDQVHLGEDIDLPEAMGIRAVAKGIIRFYGPASGYGDLVVVIEHEFPYEVEFINGLGRRRKSKYMLSIYGHLRKGRVRGEDDLDLKVGDCVQPGAIIGFINDDAHNGDGAEHLHLGFRIQSLDQAVYMDRSWFRGYDNNKRWTEYFTAPSRAISANLNNYANWHPNGTLIKTRFDPKVYLLENSKKRWIKDEAVFNNLKYDWSQVVDVSRGEMACYPQGKDLDNSDFFTLFHPHADLNQQEGYPPVLYWLSPVINNFRYYFNSIYTLYSWGIKQGNEFVGNMFNHAGDLMFAESNNQGALSLRDGTLVVEPNSNQIYIISNNGYALPLENIDMYFDLKLRSKLLVIPQSILPYLIKGYGPTITADQLLQCQKRNLSIP